MTTASTNFYGLGLEGLGDLSALLDTPSNVHQGNPLELDMGLIDEDPNQPRTEDNPGFAHESLAELSASIRLRGVKTPISVRENPDMPGRYIINHGARRFRASKRADKITIPCFIDNDYIDDDQVVENLHRDGLTAREIADHIGRKLAMGMKKGDIAKAISKSAAFVTQHVTLLDLPDPIADMFNAGRTKDVTVVNELVTAYKKNPQEVTDWLLDETQELTRGTVKLFREFLDNKQRIDKGDDKEALINPPPVEPSAEAEAINTPGNQAVDAEAAHLVGGSDKAVQNPQAANDSGNVNNAKSAVKKKALEPAKIKKAIVQVAHEGRAARLMLDRRPSASGWAWLKYEDDGAEFEAALATVQLTEILDGV
ncbi:MAG: ParB/RepB/Spo0J family partition protein [Methylovulum sp.]|nr:ParB/RepB/Spo0J family partition protein [Methylovulum sp.]